MMNIMHFYEAGKARSGVAYWAANTALGTIYRGLGISTRNGNAVVDWGDGTIQNIAPVKNTDATLLGVGGGFHLTQILHTYSSYTGNIALKFLQGLNDVYSINIGGNPFYLNQSWQSFISQFTNLFSVSIDQPHNGTSYINGDVAILPDSVERFRIADIKNSGSLYLNLSNFSSTSKLKFFNIGGGQYNQNQFGTITGDLSKLPIGITYCKLFYANAGSSITYTAGKVWASSFDTLNIPLALTHAELDNLLIDMDNSITTKIGAGVIALGGYRSAASDSAVASLATKGFTVNVIRLTRTLNLPLSANLLDTSGYANNAVMVGTESHSNSGLITGTGKYAHSPSSATLQMGAGSIGFGCEVKFNSTPSVLKGIIGKTIASATDGRYGIYTDAGNIIAITDIGATNIINQTPITPYLDGNFHKIEVFCNRITGFQYLWIDGVLINTTIFTTNSTNFTNTARFAIGSYNNAAGTGLLADTEFDGIIRNVYFDKVI